MVAVLSAIEKVTIDESGKENMCRSISFAIDTYRPHSIQSYTTRIARSYIRHGKYRVNVDDTNGIRLTPAPPPPT